ncbi:MAG: hypothetical protein KatS3mg002_0223 [Candidatus Woesearchaeota archaeon]|nr:MAG: hypothetical protein KatS3mg002_0223 [Candidatus Woesearchaeota archaeon]
MYLQITDHCNMVCPHCAFSCSPENNQFMTREIFHDAIRFISEYSSTISIGGGEPTTHPDFEYILFHSLANFDVWMSTNGKIKEKAFVLSQLAKKGIITVSLSIDDYHEPIDKEVIQWFTKKRGRLSSINSQDNDYRHIQNVTRIIKAGRAIKNNLWDVDDDCPCDVIFIEPNGKIKICGCENSLYIGHVSTGLIIPEDACMHIFNENICFNRSREWINDLFKDYKIEKLLEAA